MATCDTPPGEPEEQERATDEEEEISEKDVDIVEPKDYTKKEKRLEKLRQLRLRSVSCLISTIMLKRSSVVLLGFNNPRLYTEYRETTRQSLLP